jgi:hypothetical protein
MTQGVYIGGVLLGIRCGGPRGDPGVKDHHWEKPTFWDAPMDGAESRLWGVAFNSDTPLWVGLCQISLGWVRLCYARFRHVRLG